MNFADNWARVFVVITFLTLGEAQIIGGIVPNLIAFGLFLGAIGYFASTGKMAEMFGWKSNHNKNSCPVISEVHLNIIVLVNQTLFF